MSFQWPVLLFAIALVPAGILVARSIDRRRAARVAGLGGLARSSAPAGGRRSSTAAARVPVVLVIAGFTLLAIALARPEATVSLPRVEGTLMLTFDVSGSMAADDEQPTRMEVAKAAARAIVEKRPPGVVVGVVAFSDAGLAIQTPTSDSNEVLAAINRLGPSRGTSVGGGILASLAAIEQAETDTPPSYYSNRSAAPTEAPTPAEPGSHDAAAVILFSDGENNERPDPLSAAQDAANRGIRIHTIGVGTAAGTVLDLDGFKVQTSLDEAALRAIAERTAATYEPVASANPSAIYDQLARHIVSRDEDVELTALLAAGAFVLLIGGTLISLLRTGRLP